MTTLVLKASLKRRLSMMAMWHRLTIWRTKTQFPLLRLSPPLGQLLSSKLKRAICVKLYEALSAYYSSADLNPEQHKQLLPVLDYLAGEVVYSRKHYLFEAYTVGPNDSLESIAFQLRVPPQLLANINGLRDPSTLKAGDELKIVQGPFQR